MNTRELWTAFQQLANCSTPEDNTWAQVIFNPACFALWLQNALENDEGWVSVFETQLRAYLLARLRSLIEAPDYTGVYLGSPVSTLRLAQIFLQLDAIAQEDTPLPLSNLVPEVIGIQPIVELQERIKERLLDEVRELNPPMLSTQADVETLTQLWNEGIPFVYNRTGAAQRAIEISRLNFEGSVFVTGPATLNACYPQVNGQQPPRGVTGYAPIAIDCESQAYNVYEQEIALTYSTLQHVGVGQGGSNCSAQQSTGSAYFLSECLHFGGGLPLVASTSGTGCNTLIQDPANWLVCIGGGSNLEATSSWRDHLSLQQYLIGGEPQRIVLPFDGVDEEGQRTGMLQYFNFNINVGCWREGQEQVGPDYLYMAFRSTPLSTLETGDFMYFNLGADVSGHGFMIVGWGPAVCAISGLNSGYSYSQAFYIQRPRTANGIPQDFVPYVADFAYGYASSTQQLGWLQDVRPRPFYARLASFDLAGLQQIYEQIKGDDLSVNTNEDLVLRYMPKLRGGVYDRFARSDELNPNFEFLHLPDAKRVAFNQIYPMVYPCE